MPVSNAASTIYRPATRVHRALTASLERRVLEWMAQRAPAWVSSDQLTTLGLIGQLGAGAAYALAGRHRAAVLLVNFFLLINWAGDSLDGTLARVRQQQRPRFGFYVDHMMDVFGSIALMTGLGLSRFVHWPVAVAMLIGFLLLASESFLAASSLCRFELSQGMFGPTEIRLLLMAGNLALLRSPTATIFGHRWLLFDVGGVVAAFTMFVMGLVVTLRHTAELYQAEPLPKT